MLTTGYFAVFPRAFIVYYYNKFSNAETAQIRYIVLRDYYLKSNMFVCVYRD